LNNEPEGEKKCPFDADLMNPSTYENFIPFDLFRSLRTKCPVSLQLDSQRNKNFWAVTKRSDIDFISKNPKLFSSRENLAHPQPISENPDTMEITRQLVINMDPPEHLRFRRVIKDAFTGKAVDRIDNLMREFAKQIVDKVASKGHCDFAQEVAAEMPLFVICALVDMPLERRKNFSDLVTTMIGMDDPDLGFSEEDGQNAAAEIFGIAMELAENHLKNPNDGTLISILLNGNIDGEALTEFEFCTFFLILIAGAVETTRTATAHGMRLLIEHPDQHKLLIDRPELIEGAIEEILRFYPPFIFMQRTAVQDIQVGEMEIKKGDILRLYYPAANHDPEIFGVDADCFDVTRIMRVNDLKTKHRTFGVGQHFCVGSHLARRELLVLFEEFIPRLKNPIFSKPPEILKSNFIPGIKEMHITFDKEGSLN